MFLFFLPSLVPCSFLLLPISVSHHNTYSFRLHMFVPMNYRAHSLEYMRFEKASLQTENHCLLDQVSILQKEIEELKQRQKKEIDDTGNPNRRQNGGDGMYDNVNTDTNNDGNAFNHAANHSKSTSFLQLMVMCNTNLSTKRHHHHHRKGRHSTMFDRIQSTWKYLRSIDHSNAINNDNGGNANRDTHSNHATNYRHLLSPSALPSLASLRSSSSSSAASPISPLMLPALRTTPRPLNTPHHYPSHHSLYQLSITQLVEFMRYVSAMLIDEDSNPDRRTEHKGVNDSLHTHTHTNNRAHQPYNHSHQSAHSHLNSRIRNCDDTQATTSTHPPAPSNVPTSAADAQYLGSIIADQIRLLREHMPDAARSTIRRVLIRLIMFISSSHQHRDQYPYPQRQQQQQQVCSIHDNADVDDTTINNVAPTTNDGNDYSYITHNSFTSKSTNMGARTSPALVLACLTALAQRADGCMASDILALCFHRIKAVITTITRYVLL